MIRPLALVIAAASLTACSPPDVAGCWERCGEAACTSVEGVYLDVSATTIDEIAADSSTCSYTYEADRKDLELMPTGCSLDETGLPEVVYWSDISINEDTGRLSYTQTKVFSEEAGLDDQVRNYTFQPAVCSDLPESERLAF